MSKLYVPVEDISSNSCYFVFDAQTIRVYKNNLVVGNNSYVDYFVNSHYMSKSGVEYIQDISTINCENLDHITNDYYYRNDIAHIFVVVFCILALLLFTFKVFSRMFGRWLKV